MEHRTVSAALMTLGKDADSRVIKERLKGTNWEVANWQDLDGFGFVVNNTTGGILDAFKRENSLIFGLIENCICTSPASRWTDYSKRI